MKSEQLQRKLGVLDSTFLGLGAILGAGVFVVTGVAAQVAGPAMLVGFLVAGLVALCNALSVAQLAMVYPVSGGTYVYAGKQLHPVAGFIAGWMFLASKLAAASIVALSFSSYAHAIFHSIPARPAAIGLVVVLTLLNLLGTKKTSLVNMVIVLFTIAVLTVFVSSGLSHVKIDNLTPFAPMGLRGILQAAALLFFAYTGYARIATLGEEVKNPAVTIPRAVLMALGGSSLLYLLVSYVLVGTVPTNSLATGSPLETAVQQWDFPLLELLVAFAAIAAMVSVHLGQLLGISRMLFAMARNGDLPRVLKRISPKQDVPYISLLFTAGAVIVLVALADLFSIVSIASFAILLYYALANASALTLAQEHRAYPRFVSWVGLIACIVLALSLTSNTIITGMIVLAVGIMYYQVSRGIGRKTSDC